VRRGPQPVPPRHPSGGRGPVPPSTAATGAAASAAGDGRRPAAGARPGHDGDVQRAELEALRLLVHQPASVADRLTPLLFSDEHDRAAHATLTMTGDLHDAIRRAEEDNPAVAVLLRRLAVEEPAADADDVVVQLVWIAARRALADLDAESRLSPDAFAQLSRVTARVHSDIEELKDSDGAIKAADRLLAWLMERDEENA
jgi:hypothetical protein